MTRIAFIIINVCISIAGYSQQQAKGYVFQDVNANAKQDKKEKGISGVAVSNGLDVVLTDEKGYYELPVGNDNILFVIKPEGYKVAINQKNQPAFYYTHKPLGAPVSFKYKGASPTGALPATINFPLTAAETEENFTALLFGDPQPYNKEEVDFFSKGVVAEVEGIKGVQFGLSLGDLAGDNLDLHSPYIEAVQKIGIPWYNLMGNHDMNYDAVTDSLADETYESNFGPANYSFNYGKVHFIVLDDILYPDPKDGQGYLGGFRKDQLDFIENDLKYVNKDKLVVLSMHIPLKSKNYRREDRDRLFSLLKDFPNTLSISAHTHLQRNDLYTAGDNWLGKTPHHEYNAGTTSGDWYSGELNEMGIPVSTMRDGTPKGYAFIHFKGNKYVIDYKVAGKPSSYQIQVFSPKLIPFKRKTSSRVYANFFMGREDSKVEYRIDNKEWKSMTFSEDNDPSFLALLFRWDLTEELMPGRRPSNAEPSTHLWSAAFPPNLAEGAHTVEVRATDMFGRTFTESKTFKVQKL